MIRKLNNGYKALVLKIGNDSFEREINKWFQNNNIAVEVIQFGHYSGVSKRIYYIRLLKRIKFQYGNIKMIIFDDTCLYLYSKLFFLGSYLWLWNTLPQTKMERLRLLLCRINGRVYTFDKNESIKYKLGFNTQFFTNDLHLKSEIKQDIYFVGRDKGRYFLVKNLYDFCSKNGISTLFQLFRDDDKQRYDCPEILSNEFVEYNDVINNIAESRIVLDLCKEGQSGMTFRAVEALFLNKKIITNNIYYKELPFYSSEMIYVIENNDFSGLYEFIKSETVGYDESYRDYYSIEKWLGRFR